MMTERIDNLSFPLMKNLSHCNEQFEIVKVETYITKKSPISISILQSNLFYY